MTRFIAILIFFGCLIGNGSGTLALPPCPEEPEVPWNDCIGTFIYSNGDKYVGAFKEGIRSGDGKYIYANGNKYIGQWVAGKKNGKGKFIFPNGNKYAGDFVDGKWTGKGTLTNYFGDKYIGEFKDGKRHGKGTVSSLDGFNYEGIFKNDVIVIGKGRVIKATKPSKIPKNICPGARNARCPSPPKGQSGIDLSLGAERSGFSKTKK